eukprot:6214374-Pleurochrysis_carterae.AAC.3
MEMLMRALALFGARDLGHLRDDLGARLDGVDVLHAPPRLPDLALLVEGRALVYVKRAREHQRARERLGQRAARLDLQSRIGPLSSSDTAKRVDRKIVGGRLGGGRISCDAAPFRHRSEQHSAAHVHALAARVDPHSRLRRPGYIFSQPAFPNPISRLPTGPLARGALSPRARLRCSDHARVGACAAARGEGARR